VVSLDTNSSSNRAAATITVGAWDGSTSATFKLGGLTGTNNSTSAFIDDNIYALRDRTTNMTDTTEIAGSTSNVTSNMSMVSYKTAPVPTLFSNAGVTPCTCSFMSWGWWGGDVSYSNTSGYNPGGRDRMNLSTYVVGTQSLPADVAAQTATATYNGHVVGSVVNGANSYVAAGSYTNVWNFGSRNGIATVTFDGRTYGGGSVANTFSPSGTSNIQTTGGSIASGDRSITLTGAFMSGGASNPVAGQAGSFSATGTNYKAGGTFAAQK
jgi:hypothetical protein